MIVLKNTNFNYASYFDLSTQDAPVGGNTYGTSPIDTGVVYISRNDTNVIAGTFNLNVANDSGKIVHITDGRFDITK